MDVDLDERCGLAGRARSHLDADALQFHKANHAGCGWLQLPEQVAHHNGAYRGLRVILDRYFLVERQGRKPRGVSKMVDPLVSCDRSNPRSERSRGRIRMPVGM